MPGLYVNAVSPHKPKLLDLVRQAIRTKQAYVQWIKRYILYRNKRHPQDMAEKEINQYLTYLAVQKNVASSTQNQALCAIIFLYREVLKRDIGDLECLAHGSSQRYQQTVATAFTRFRETVQARPCGSWFDRLEDNGTETKSCESRIDGPDIKMRK